MSDLSKYDYDNQEYPAVSRRRARPKIEPTDSIEAKPQSPPPFEFNTGADIRIILLIGALVILIGARFIMGLPARPDPTTQAIAIAAASSPTAQATPRASQTATAVQTATPSPAAPQTATQAARDAVTVIVETVIVEVFVPVEPSETIELDPTPVPSDTATPTTAVPLWVQKSNNDTALAMRRDNLVMDIFETLFSRPMLVIYGLIVVLIIGRVIPDKWESAIAARTEELEAEARLVSLKDRYPINDYRRDLRSRPTPPDLDEPEARKIAAIILEGKESSRSGIAVAAFGNSGGDRLQRVDKVGEYLKAIGLIDTYPPPPFGGSNIQRPDV